MDGSLKYLVSCLVLCVISAPAALGAGGVSLSFGARQFDSEREQLGERETRNSVGIAGEFGRDTWPIRFVIMQQVYEDPLDERDYLGELSIGIAKRWRSNQRIEPFVGGGITYVRVLSRLAHPPVATADNGGFYASAGLLLRVGDRFSMGVGARIVESAEGLPISFGKTWGGQLAAHEQIEISLGWRRRAGD